MTNRTVSENSTVKSPYKGAPAVYLHDEVRAGLGYIDKQALLRVVAKTFDRKMKKDDKTDVTFKGKTYRMIVKVPHLGYHEGWVDVTVP